MGASSSKLSFKQSVFRLFEEPNISPIDPFWAQFWELPESADDIFALFSSSDVRRTRDTALMNLEHLLVSVISRLVYLLRQSQIHYSLTPQQLQPPDLSSGSAGGAVGSGEQSLSAARATKETLNCMRIITRIMPFIYESPDLADWQHDLFWGTDAAGDEDARHEASEEDDADDRPLGAALVETLTDFLFLPGFAIPLVQGMPTTVAYVIWETGIGSTTPVGTTSQFESNKIETLQTMLALASQAMYYPAHVLPIRGVRFMSYIVCNPDKRVVLGMLCSLLNTTMKYNPGWRVPYNHVVFSDPRQLLVTYALQLLIVLATYSVPEDENLSSLGIHIPEEADDNAPSNSQTLQNVSRKHQKNWYRFYLARLHRIQDLQFLADGMSRLLNQPMQASASYLPGSQKQVEWAPELIMLFWELIRHNSRFRNYIISSDRIHDFVVLFLYYAHTYRLDPSRVGLVRLCVYVLQTISCDSVFCVRLNKPFDSHHALPSSMRISGWDSSSAGSGGTYTDYLLLSIYSLITTSNGRLSALYPCLLDIQINLSPHIVNIGRLTCIRLMNLFSALSTPSFMVANENNHMLVDKLLLAMNGMIANNNHQANANLLYTIMRAGRRFEALRDLTFERCMEDVRLQRRLAGSAGATDRKDDVIIIFNADDAADMPSGADALSDYSKRKGKGKASGESEGSMDSSPQASASIKLSSEDGDPFTPTRSWFESWHSKLHLHIILHLLDVLPTHVPRLNILPPLRSASSSTTASPTRRTRLDNPAQNAEILDALRHLDDEAVLPESCAREFHEPIAFEWTVAAKGWYYSVLWGAIFVMHEVVGSESASGIASAVTGVAGGAANGVGSAVGVWRGTKVVLFRVQETKAAGPSLLRPRGAVDAVAKSVLERLGGGGQNQHQQQSSS
ncbi:high-temperature-induced dauer-formation protein-domain-containing protein [Lipomyces tetrasporus]|uniref:High-temperature-induced dauer-formation protein-domain-containing protein n=1 Tax=Lipomyces tetrasporus TaxID=54092 RepID=A0AAD7QTB8_9ASCO|nr:high-temperature-induced dauer-formation protein-domain-containing protein [Lipomyces tetrasporus]KAJ8100964.1 high-temperature-induced dauer-formation protein-domain-containing protein [Lipomyces tetrasporus]